MKLFGPIRLWLSTWIERIRELATLPAVEISLGFAQGVHADFTRPHPRYKIIGRKVLGVALVRVPSQFEKYLKGKDQQALRTNRKKAIRNGFTFITFDPLEHIDEILAINTSSEVRAGRPMDAPYLDAELVRAYFSDKRSVYGICDQTGKIQAYCYAPVCGETAILFRLLGCADLLSEGIMYLMISEIIREMSERQNAAGRPLWVMYDTFFGAAPGLRYSKRRMGFRPYKVKWILDARDVAAGEAEPVTESRR
jgi:hypothetical protein